MQTYFEILYENNTTTDWRLTTLRVISVILKVRANMIDDRTYVLASSVLFWNQMAEEKQCQHDIIIF